MVEPQQRQEVDLSEPNAVSGTCQFCGRTYWIVLDIHSVAHDVPHCLEFETLDPLSFCRTNREIRESKVARA